MKDKQYLTFRLHDIQYAIEAALVQEMFSLPELTPIPEANTDIMGLLNVRGQILPIIHLDLLQGHPVEGCQLSDYVIVSRWEGFQFGMAVHQVNEVLEINNESIKNQPYDGFDINIDSAFIMGVADMDYGEIVLLDPKTLIPQPDVILTLIWDAQMQLDRIAASPTSEVEQQLEQDESQQDEPFQPSTILPSFYDLYCPNATPEEREIFRQRANNLRQSIESAKVTNELIPLAVIGFGNEYFGLDLELVREFTDVGNLTPIPCCPNHIVGNMNLRGEIITLVDIRNVLNLSPAPVDVGSQVVVVQVDDIVAGLPVDQVLEMAYLNSADLTPLTPSLYALGEQYLRGTASFQEKTLKVLDLPQVFKQGELVVNEQA